MGRVPMIDNLNNTESNSPPTPSVRTFSGALRHFISKVISHLNVSDIQEQLSDIKQRGFFNYARYLSRYLSSNMGEPAAMVPKGHSYRGIKCYTWLQEEGRAESIYNVLIFPDHVSIELQTPTEDPISENTSGDYSTNDDNIVGTMVAYASHRWNEANSPNPINGGLVNGNVIKISEEIRENRDGLAGAILLGPDGLRIINHDELMQMENTKYASIESTSVIPTTLVIDTDNIDKVLRAKHLVRDSLGPRLLEYNFMGVVNYVDGSNRVMVFSSERQVHIKYVLDCVEGIKLQNHNIRRIRLALTEQTKGRFSPRGPLSESLVNQGHTIKTFTPALRSLFVFRDPT